MALLNVVLNYYNEGDKTQSVHKHTDLPEMDLKDHSNSATIQYTVEITYCRIRINLEK